MINFLLKTPDANTNSFKILLIASEIIIPLIVFIGAYYIFKPVLSPKTEEEKPDEVVDKDDIDITKTDDTEVK